MSIVKQLLKESNGGKPAPKTQTLLREDLRDFDKEIMAENASRSPGDPFIVQGVEQKNTVIILASKSELLYLEKGKQLRYMSKYMGGQDVPIYLPSTAFSMLKKSI